MKPIIQNQVIYKILKSKQDNAILPSSQKCISLNTAGTHSTVLLNPSSNTPYINIQSKTLDEIRSQAGLTENQMKIMTGGIRICFVEKIYSTLLSRACIRSVTNLRYFLYP